MLYVYFDSAHTTLLGYMALPRVLISLFLTHYNSDDIHTDGRSLCLHGGNCSNKKKPWIVNTGEDDGGAIRDKSKGHDNTKDEFQLKQEFIIYVIVLTWA